MKALKRIGSFALVLFMALAAGFSQAHASEIDLKVPSLDVGYDIFGLSVTGSQILMYGLILCVLGMAFGFYEFFKILAITAHEAMLNVSNTIYETCKTYMKQQSKLLVILELFIAVCIFYYFYYLNSTPMSKVLTILMWSILGILGSFCVAWFGMRINTYANSRTAFLSLQGKPYPVMSLPLRSGMSIGVLLICVELIMMIAILLYYLVRFIIRHCHISLIRQDCYTRVGLILAGAFGAYALGANNIANVMGVFVSSSPLQAVDFGSLFTLSPTQVLFFIGGIAISVGVFTYSRGLMTTVGNGIIQMSPLMAWVAVVSQALVLFLFASQNLQHFLDSHNLPSFPLVPVSSSQAIIGAVIGIGILKGCSINWGLLGRIVIGWILTPITAALVCYISLFFLQNVFNLEVCR